MFLSRVMAVVFACHLTNIYASDEPQDLSGFDCLIKPHSVADVSTREQGVVTKLLVDRGDLISKGQAIAQLDADIEEATVKLAKARAHIQAEIDEMRVTTEFAKRELDRVKELYEKNAVSPHDMDKASFDSARAEFQLKQALNRQRIADLDLERSKRLLDRRTIYSPIQGVVVERKISLGESVDNRPILQLAEVNPLNVEVIIPIEFYGVIDSGMRAEVSPKYPDATMQHADVAVVDRVIDPASDTFGVRLKLANPELKIPGGVRCDIRFIKAEIAPDSD